MVTPTRCTISQFYFILEQHYMFRMVSPSITRSLKLYIQHQYMSYRFLWLLASKQPQEPVWYDAVCTILDSWWWMERPSKTCRVLFQNKINLRYCASGWCYYRNILRCMVPQMSNLAVSFQNYNYLLYVTQSADKQLKKFPVFTFIY